MYVVVVVVVTHTEGDGGRTFRVKSCAGSHSHSLGAFHSDKDLLDLMSASALQNV